MKDFSQAYNMLKNTVDTVGELLEYLNTQSGYFRRELEAVIRDLEVLENSFEDEEKDISFKESLVKDLELEVEKQKSKLSQLKNIREEGLRKRRELEEEEKKTSLEISRREIEVENLKKSVQNLENTVKDRSARLEDYRRELTGLRVELDRELSLLKEKLKSYESEIAKLESTYKAVRFLVENKLMKNPELQIIESLVGKTSSTIDYLQKTTLLRRDFIKQVIRSLEKRSILEYDEENDTIRVLRKIEL